MMRMVDIIRKKRDGFPLTEDEIHFWVRGYTKGDIPDYQISALLMAIYYQGMNAFEVAQLTREMVHSGETVDLSAIHGLKVDKHSTGGVGDKTSLVIAPLVASVGVPVAKMSGRGLGHTGGTIDKLEAIEGFRVELSKEQFITHVNQYKMAIIGQSSDITPADKLLYALRDVTATVESIPLLASSIMSKKIASGADAILLDVKIGSGAFMKSLDEASELAKTMVQIGASLNRKTVAIISNMDQPLGFEIGNANEVREAIEVLQGKKVEDVREISLMIAAHMTVLGGVYTDLGEAYNQLEKRLDSGAALPVLKAFVASQGGDPDLIDHPERLPQARKQVPVYSEQEGYIKQMDAQQIGLAAMLVGAGRKTKNDVIDHAVGITLKKKVGDYVSAGEEIAIVHCNQNDHHESIAMVKKAITYSKQPGSGRTMIYDTLSS